MLLEILPAMNFHLTGGMLPATDIFPLFYSLRYFLIVGITSHYFM